MSQEAPSPTPENIHPYARMQQAEKELADATAAYKKDHAGRSLEANLLLSRTEAQADNFETVLSAQEKQAQNPNYHFTPEEAQAVGELEEANRKDKLAGLEPITEDDYRYLKAMKEADTQTTSELQSDAAEADSSATPSGEADSSAPSEKSEKLPELQQPDEVSVDKGEPVPTASPTEGVTKDFEVGSKEHAEWVLENIPEAENEQEVYDQPETVRSESEEKTAQIKEEAEAIRAAIENLKTEIEQNEAAYQALADERAELLNQKAEFVGEEEKTAKKGRVARFMSQLIGRVRRTGAYDFFTEKKSTPNPAADKNKQLIPTPVVASTTESLDEHHQSMDDVVDNEEDEVALRDDSEEVDANEQLAEPEETDETVDTAEEDTTDETLEEPEETENTSAMAQQNTSKKSLDALARVNGESSHEDSEEKESDGNNGVRVLTAKEADQRARELKREAGNVPEVGEELYLIDPVTGQASNSVVERTDGNGGYIVRFENGAVRSLNDEMIAQLRALPSEEREESVIEIGETTDTTPEEDEVVLPVEWTE